MLFNFVLVYPEPWSESCPKQAAFYCEKKSAFSSNAYLSSF